MDDLTELPGVGPSTAERLKEAGFTDFMKIATATVKELCEVEGISEKAAHKIIEAAKQMCNLGFKKGSEIL